MTQLIGFIGGPSTGKTTLAAAVYNDLQEQGSFSSWASEFVSDDIQRIGPPNLDYYIYEQFRYLFHQQRREEAALRKSDIILTDSPLLIGYAYTIQQQKTAVSGRQSQFVDELYTLFSEDAQRYDNLYLLKREANFEDNGIRFHTQAQSQEFDALLKELLAKNNVAYTEISGSVEERKATVMKDIKLVHNQATGWMNTPH